MTFAGDARQAILQSIRDSLAASAAFDVAEGQPRSTGRAPLPLAPAAHLIDATVEDADPARRFMQQVTSVGASCEIVADEKRAAASVAWLLSTVDAHHVAASDASLVKRVLAAMPAPPGVRDVDELSRDEMFACDAGITTAQFGIAETGTLVLESAREKNRLLSLVPPVHIALLRAGDICGSLSEVLTRLSETWKSPERASHAITFITGPSRTSDIELTLTIGVHGPRVLHVIILEGQS